MGILWQIVDEKKNNTLRIDLWTKEMKTDEMKRFYIDCLGGLSQSILNSTGDEYMSKETNKAKGIFPVLILKLIIFGPSLRC